MGTLWDGVPLTHNWGKKMPLVQKPGIDWGVTILKTPPQRNSEIQEHHSPLLPLVHLHPPHAAKTEVQRGGWYIQASQS